MAASDSFSDSTDDAGRSRLWDAALAIFIPLVVAFLAAGFLVNYSSPAAVWIDFTIAAGIGLTAACLIYGRRDLAYRTATAAFFAVMALGPALTPITALLLRLFP